MRAQFAVSFALWPQWLLWYLRILQDTLQTGSGASSCRTLGSPNSLFIKRAWTRNCQVPACSTMLWFLQENIETRYLFSYLPNQTLETALNSNRKGSLPFLAAPLPKLSLSAPQGDTVETKERGPKKYFVNSSWSHNWAKHLAPPSTAPLHDLTLPFLSRP